jgi:phasin family protein
MVQRNINDQQMTEDKTMANEVFTQWTSSAQQAYNSLLDLANINSEVAQQLLQKQQGFISSAVETGAEQVDLLSKSKDYKDLMSLQAKLVQTNTDNAIAYAKEITGILDDAKAQYSSWFEKGVEAATKSIEIPKTKKAA